MSVQQALVKFENRKVTHLELAKFIGFNDNELQLLKIFWQPCYNEGWIYLSPKLIKEDMGYSYIPKFYKDTLKKKYLENIDYKEIQKDDDLVKLYEKFGVPKSTPKKKENRGGHNSKYYAITGKALKKMLMRCRTDKSDQVCDYYIKVEELAAMMYKYLLQSEKLKNDNRSLLLKSFVDSMEVKKPNGYYYIATSVKYAGTNFFKCGITTNRKNRLRQYNTERPENDMIYYAFIHECHDPAQIEKKLKYLLRNFQRKNIYKHNFDETYHIAYTKLYNIVDIVCKHHDEEVDVLNDIINTFEADFMGTPIIPDPIVIERVENTVTLEEKRDGVVTNTRAITVDVSNMTTEQKDQTVKNAMEQLIKQTKPTFNYETNIDDDEKIIIDWKDLQVLLKPLYDRPSEWRVKHWKQSINNIKNNSNCIQKIAWRC
jgi:phage anti-repressor protein